MAFALYYSAVIAGEEITLNIIVSV